MSVRARFSNSIDRFDSIVTPGLCCMGLGWPAPTSRFDVILNTQQVSLVAEFHPTSNIQLFRSLYLAGAETPRAQGAMGL